MAERIAFIAGQDFMCQRIYVQAGIKAVKVSAIEGGLLELTTAEGEVLQHRDKLYYKDGGDGRIIAIEKQEYPFTMKYNTI